MLFFFSVKQVIFREKTYNYLEKNTGLRPNVMIPIHKGDSWHMNVSGQDKYQFPILLDIH